MKKITIEEILNVIDNTSIELYNSEWDELKVAFEKFLDTKKGTTGSTSGWGNPIPKLKDEWGNTDWRDTGEMGG
jgi:hypothetical protein